MKKSLFSSLFPFCMILFCLALCICISGHAKGSLNDEEVWDVGYLVKKDQRRPLVSTEYGQISAVSISDRINGSYHLQFITLEPNSLFLPVILHADMVFYVPTGSGILSWTDEDKIEHVNLHRGDVYRLQTGTSFYIQSNLEPERQKLRIHAIFANSAYDLHEPIIGAYSSIRDLVLGFDKKVLQAAFQVPEEVIEAITQETLPPPIMHGVPKVKRTFWEEIDTKFVNTLLGSKGFHMFDENKKKEKKVFNILNEKPDFENCNGRSLTVTSKKLHALEGSNIGLFMVNLTAGSMMGPHWNPLATEIAVVLQGRGMIQVVCPSSRNETECKNMRFRVEEGDVFAVPRYHPMSQMSFNNDTFVFMGFSTTAKENYPQFLAGKWSVLKTLDKQVLAASFNVTNETIDKILAPQGDAVILGCTSCAEEEEKIIEEEIEKEKKEAREKEEEEARKREEEKKREEEAARKREEEKKREEEEEEEARKKEEEEARKREEEEEARKREEETRRQEEEKKREEEEEARKRAEEEAKRREEAAAARKREKEEKQKRQEAAEREEAEAKRQEQELEKQLQEGSKEGHGKQEEEEVKERQQHGERETEEGQEEQERTTNVLKNMW